MIIVTITIVTTKVSVDVIRSNMANFIVSYITTVIVARTLFIRTSIRSKAYTAEVAMNGVT